MKIVALQVENFLRISAVLIKPDGNLVEIAGANGQGKTSVLNAIWCALAGRAAEPPRPIRKGQERALIKVNLGELVVTRTFTPAKDGGITSHLRVTNAEGTPFTSPQKVLDELMGVLTFDPLEFARMKPREQYDALRGLVPGVDFDAIDKLNAADYELRRQLNVQRAGLDAQAAAIKISPMAPTERVDEKPLLDQMQNAAAHNGKIEQDKLGRERLQAAIKDKQELAGARRREAAEAREEAVERDNFAVEFEQDALALQEKFNALPALAATIDVQAVREELEQVQIDNTVVDQIERRERFRTQIGDLAERGDALTAAMEKRNAAKKQAVAEAKLPVEGLALGEGMVLMNSVPFSQASDAEQLRASIALAMAMNPKLRVLRVRDGSLLDERSLELVRKMATDGDFQVWMELVGGTEVGFELVDGHLKE